MTREKCFGFASLLAITVFAANAHANDVECYFSEECDDDLICFELACVAPDAPLASCADDSECATFEEEEYIEVCDNGYCKPAAVLCGNEDGSCDSHAVYAYCDCENGPAVWPTELEAQPLSGEALYAECREHLTEQCWSEIPCSDEQFAYCESGENKYSALNNNCLEDGYYLVMATCCEDPGSVELSPAHRALIDCYLALDDDDCEEAAACQDTFWSSLDEEDGENGAETDVADADEDLPSERNQHNADGVGGANGINGGGTAKIVGCSVAVTSHGTGLVSLLKLIAGL